MNNNDLFLDYYMKLESSLREYYKNNDLGFSVVIKRIFDLKESNNKEKKERGMKLEVAKQLRNNLAHLIKDKDGKDYFVVSDEMIEFLKNAINLVTESMSAIGVCQPISKVLKCKKEDKVIDILSIMRDTKHSHIPVVDEGKVVGIFNMQAIVDKILKNKEFKLNQNDEVKDFMTKIKECYAFDFDFIPRNKPFYEIERMFEKENNNKQLKMLFVTDNGLKSEKILGIITAYDILKYN